MGFYIEKEKQINAIIVTCIVFLVYSFLINTADLRKNINFMWFSRTTRYNFSGAKVGKAKDLRRSVATCKK